MADKYTEVCRATAKLAMQTLQMAPVDVRLEASVMVLKSIFLTNVKPERRLDLFNDTVEKIRNEIVNDLQQKESPNGKKAGHRRGGGSKDKGRKTRRRSESA